MFQDLEYSTMTLGDLIAELERFPSDMEVGVPMGFGSWRGVYSELTIHPDFTDAETQTVGELLTLAREAVGGTFTGYKGGEFVMKATTQVWADGYGSSAGRRPVGLRSSKDGRLVIQIMQVDPY